MGLTCPRCHAPLPETATYAPCSACRAALNASADARATHAALRAAEAVSAGWRWDPTEGRHGAWINPEGDLP